MTPAASPLNTENETPIQFSICIKYRIANVATAMRAAATFVPRLSECSSSFMVAPSFVRTRNMPISDRNMPTAAMTIGAITALSCISESRANAVAPMAAVLRMLPQ